MYELDAAGRAHALKEASVGLSERAMVIPVFTGFDFILADVSLLFGPHNRGSCEFLVYEVN